MNEVTVTQADREAAAAWAKANSRHAQAANMRRGSCDTAPLVQAFARHRQAALADAQREPVAWQKRSRYALGLGAPGAIPQWELCSKREATGHFEKQPGYEYRPLYTHPPAKDVAALVEAANAMAATLAAIRATTAGDDWADSAQHFHDLAGQDLAAYRTALTKHERTPHEPV